MSSARYLGVKLIVRTLQDRRDFQHSETSLLK